MFDIALHELRLIFMDRSIWLNLVVIPIVISFAVGLGNDAASGGGTDSGPLLRVDVLNSDAGAQGNALLERMRAANQNLILCPQDNTEDDACRLDGAALTTDLARERLTRETSLALLIIPEGFSARLDAGESSSLIYRSSDNAAAPGFILQALQAAAQQVGSAQTAARVGIEVAGNLDYLRFSDDADRDAFAAQIRDAATQAWETPPAQVALVTSQGETADGFSGFNQSVPGIASMYVMFAIFPAAAVLIRERKLGTFQRVLMMPVHRWQLLGGKMSARFVIGAAGAEHGPVCGADAGPAGRRVVAAERRARMDARRRPHLTSRLGDGRIQRAVLQRRGGFRGNRHPGGGAAGHDGGVLPHRRAAFPVCVGVCGNRNGCARGGRRTNTAGGSVLKPPACSHRMQSVFGNALPRPKLKPSGWSGAG
jgi:hypothetical protein